MTFSSHMAPTRDYAREQLLANSSGTMARSHTSDGNVYNMPRHHGFDRLNPMDRPPTPGHGSWFAQQHQSHSIPSPHNDSFVSSSMTANEFRHNEYQVNNQYQHRQQQCVNLMGHGGQHTQEDCYREHRPGSDYHSRETNEVKMKNMADAVSPQDVRYFDTGSRAHNLYGSPYCDRPLPSMPPNESRHTAAATLLGMERLALPNFGSPVASSHVNHQHSYQQQQRHHYTGVHYNSSHHELETNPRTPHVIRTQASASPVSNFSASSSVESYGMRMAFTPIRLEHEQQDTTTATAIGSRVFAASPAANSAPNIIITPKKARTGRQKTELCRYFSSRKPCPFGEKCSYAHGDRELRNATMSNFFSRCSIPACNNGVCNNEDTPLPSEAQTFRAHLCPTWVATGACPYQNRCSLLHDPRIEGPNDAYILSKDMLSRKPFTSHDKNRSDTNVLDTLNCCFTYESEVIDSLSNVRNAELLKGNPFPLSASLPHNGGDGGPSVPDLSMIYDAVSNINPRVVHTAILGADQSMFDGSERNDGLQSRVGSNRNSAYPPADMTASEAFYLLMEIRETTRNHQGTALEGRRLFFNYQAAQQHQQRSVVPQERSQTLTEAQRLTIALAMRGNPSVYKCLKFWPTHTLYSQKGCMVIQSRTFWVARQGHDVQEAASGQQQWTGRGASGPHYDLVTAHELVFGPAEKRNVLPCSIWFNLADGRDLAPCSTLMAKKYIDDVKGRKGPCLSCNDNFNIDLPFPGVYERQPSSSRTNHRHHGVKMLRLDDSLRPFFQVRPYDQVSFDLVTAMIQHRLETCRGGNTESVRLAADATAIAHQFHSQGRFWNTWMWPKNLGHPTEMTYDTYAPLVCGEYNMAGNGTGSQRPGDNAVADIWTSFVKTMDDDTAAASGDEGCRKGRLRVFKHLVRGSALISPSEVSFPKFASSPSSQN